jgi:hypothetical protein
MTLKRKLGIAAVLVVIVAGRSLKRPRRSTSLSKKLIGA